jgi:hypothetical protein
MRNALARRSVGGIVVAPSNADMLAWFAEDERDDCGSCGQRSCVTVAGAVASFCLACGAVTIDDIRIDANLRVAV